MSECFAKIEAQQAKLTENSAPWVVGEQLKEICQDPYCAELVSADLDNADMSLANCEKKIKAYHPHKHTDICRPVRDGCANPLCEHRPFCSAH